MKALLIVISKWAQPALNSTRLIFCGLSKSGPTRAKNDEYIGICMEKCPKKP